jgi:putative Holliday junction resolvase
MQDMPEPDAGFILAFDYGLKRIGVAIGNTLTGSASPLTTLTQGQQGIPWEQIDELIRCWQPKQLLLGLPQERVVQHHGSNIVSAVKNFGAALSSRYHLPLNYIDEHLSSAEATSLLIQQRASGEKKRLKKKDIDQQAATLILQSWLRETSP